MSEFEYGREPLQIVEIEQPACSLTFGTAPCNATGATKCFNTRATCKVPNVYNPEAKIFWRFIRPQTGALPLLYEEVTTPRSAAYDSGYSSGYEVFSDDLKLVKTNAIPSLVSASTTPTQINIGAADENVSPFGRRATLSVTFSDHPDDDNFGDPYLSSRDYIAVDTGTFWGKWTARNPYSNRYRINVYDGYRGQGINDMQVRTYFIDRIDGPDSNGKVRVIAKDPLKFVDDKRALVPAPIEAEILQEIDDTTQITTISVQGVIGDFDKAIGTAGIYFARVNDELFQYTGVTDNLDGSVTLTGVSRSALSSEIQDHSIGDSIQRVLRYVDTPCWEAAKDLLVNYGFVPEELIPYQDWVTEGTTHIPAFNITGTVVDPTAVNTLVGELSRDCLFYIWWDERDRLINFQAIHPPTEKPKLITDRENIIAGSFSIKTDPNQRISRLLVYYGQTNPVKKLDELGNYSKAVFRVNATVEADDIYGESRTKRIYSRWLSTFAQATQVTVVLLEKFIKDQKTVTFRLDAKDRDLWTAGVVDVVTRYIQSDTGRNPSTRMQVISAEETVPGEVVTYQLQPYEYGGRYWVWMPDDAPDYLVATDLEREIGGWWSEDDGTMPNGDEGYLWQ